MLQFPVVHAENADNADNADNTFINPMLKEKFERLKGYLFKAATPADEETDTETSTLSPPVVTDDEVLNYIAHETGRDRLDDMFSKNHLNYRSAELDFVYGSAEKALVISAFVFAMLGAGEARDKYIRENKLTVYKTIFLKHRNVHDHQIMGMMKNGARWGFKVGAFTLSFLMISQCIAVYRNKTTPFDYCIAGMLTGAVFRVNLGLRGMVGAGFFGSTFGLAAGLMIYGLRYASDTLQHQTHFTAVKTEFARKRTMLMLRDNTPAGLSQEEAAKISSMEQQWS